MFLCFQSKEKFLLKVLEYIQIFEITCVKYVLKMNQYYKMCSIKNMIYNAMKSNIINNINSFDSKSLMQANKTHFPVHLQTKSHIPNTQKYNFPKHLTP